METAGGRPAELTGWRFLNFLRGMETALTLVVQEGDEAFLNFLRGMETPWSCRGPPESALLPKLP